MMNSNPIGGYSGVGEAAVPEFTTALQNRIDRMGDEELTAAIVETKRALEALPGTFHMFVADFDRRAIGERVHVLTTKQWLTSTCAVSAKDASGVVTTAKALGAMPTVCEGALTGAVPATHVRILAQARDRRPEAFQVHEAVFANIATYLDARDLRRAVGHWRQQVDHAAAVEDTTQRRARRRLTVDRTFDDMWAVSGELDPESGLVVSTAVASHADPGNLDSNDNRTPGQRRADALTDICRYWLDHNADTTVTSGGTKPHVTVTLDYATLTDALGRLSEVDGTPVAPETIRRLACDAGIIPTLLGSDSEPLDIGRRSPSLRRSDERSNFATRDAHGPGATPRCRGATYTTSRTGSTEGSPPWQTSSSCAANTTQPCTKAAVPRRSLHDPYPSSNLTSAVYAPGRFGRHLGRVRG